MRIRTAWWLLAAGLVVAGCGGGSNSGGGGGGTTKTTPTVTAWPTASAITYGQTLAASILSGGTASVTGSFSWTSSTTSPGAGTPSEGVTFTPADTTDYNTVAGTANVTVNKATPTVSVWPTASAIAFGQTLASSTLSGGTASVPGTFSWTTPATSPATGTTSDGVTFTATDAADYNTVAGSANVTVNKATPTVSTWPTASAITSGQTLASSTLSGGAASVSGTFSWTNSATVPNAGAQTESVTFTPSDTTDYTTVTGSVSVTVNPVAPTVTAVVPTSGSTEIAITSAVTATFNQAMTSSTITASTFTLTGPGNTSVQGTVGYNAGTSVATFTPTANLAYNTTYAATLSTSIMSSTSVALAAPYTWSFTTAAAPVPTVTTTAPASGAANVNVGNALTATFSQPMNSSTVTATTFTLATTTGNTPVAGLVTYNTGTSTATFTPSASLAYSTSYTATITTGATSSAGAALASNYVWSFTTGANPNQVTVDFGTTYQTIRGFGGSTAWLGHMPSAVSTALFNPTSGLGLSILRLRIDPQGLSTGGGTHGDPYETSEWDYEAANGADAVAANPKAIVFASPWTAPSAWKLNGTSTTVSGTVFNEAFNGSCGEGAGYCGGYLDPNHYADYANYLEDFVKFFNTTDSFHLYAISMQNEPEFNATYESSVWTPQQMDTWIAGNASTITSDAYSTKLIMPESDTFNPVDAATALNDTNAQGLISIIGGHLYGVQPAPYSIPSGDSPKEIWMTEFGPLSNAQLTWVQAMTTYGESIHNSMVTGQYNAYVWWGVFGNSAGSCATSAGTCGLVDNAGNVQPMGEVMGQYSKFIQPGYVRVMATANPLSGVYVSAYSNASPAHYVIVAINANTTSESLTFALSNATVTSVTPYESSSTLSLAAQTAVTVTSGQFNYTLPAQSIVTFVQ